ncbi:DUF58 domain-containing protein [Brachybacterium huguangmaarense]
MSAPPAADAPVGPPAQAPTPGTGTSSRLRARRGAAATARARALGGRALEAARTAAGRVAARLGPPLGVITPAGWALLAAAVACWTVGLTLHVTELNVIAVMLTVPLLIAGAFILGRSAYRVSLDLSATRVVVGERALGTIEIANEASRAMLPSRIELTVGGATAQFLVPRLEPEQSHEEVFAIPTRRREVLVVGPVRSVRDDPLGLMRRQVTWAHAQDVFVHPATARLEGFETGYLRDLEGTPSSALTSSDIAFHALREYVPGDDRRHVHWRSTARTGRLMVRQFEETRRSHVVVALANIAGQFEDDQEFELAVSVAASLAAQTLREEKELTARSVDAAQRTSAYRALMDDYTVVDAVRARHGLRDLARDVADEAPNASAVMLVVGSGAEITELASAAAQLPPGVQALAIRCRLGEPVHRARIGTLGLVTLGALEDLPRALRAATA